MSDNISRLYEAHKFASYVSDIISKNKHEGTIYLILLPFIQKFKVGFSTNVEKRLSGIRLKYSEPKAVVITEMKGERFKERELHYMLRKHNWDGCNYYNFKPRELYNINADVVDTLSPIFNDNIFAKHIHYILSMGDCAEILELIKTHKQKLEQVKNLSK
jgi:hypothetical protein